MNRKSLLWLVILLAVTISAEIQGPTGDKSEEKTQSKTDSSKDSKDKGESSKKDFVPSVEDREGASPIHIEPSPDLSKEKPQVVNEDVVENELLNPIDLLVLDRVKEIQKMVEEFDRLKSLSSEDKNLIAEVENLPPPPKEAEEVPLTKAQEEAKVLYEKAMTFLNKTKPDKGKAFDILLEAMGENDEAKALVAWAKLFGNPLKQNLDEAKFIFDELAERGHPDGHTGLGFLYASGLSVNVSQSKALLHYTFGAIGGHTWAQMALGYRYWTGVTVLPSCENALDFYRQVADKVSQGVSFGGGAAIQRIRLLDELENGYNSGILDNDLIEYYQLLAEKGDIQAQVALGQLHYQGGRGVELDYEKAMHYFSQAAYAGNAIAMAYLGKIYLDGSDEIEVDYDAAFRYFKKASDLNNPVGQSGLGLMYLYGRGVKKDHVKAHKYFMAAADQGWVDGQLQLGNMYFNGLGVKQDYKQANKYFSLASQSGHVLAFYNLGQMHARGTGLIRSCPTGVELFKNVAERGKWGELLMQAHADYREGNHDESFVQYALLAELGYEVAQSNAAFQLDRGEIKMFNRQEALVRALLYWSRAAAQGYSAAQVKLGDYHYYGLGTPVDYEAAATHYRIASEQQHNAQAMFNLGYMHEQGLGMERDIHLAKRCYDLAAETSNDAKVPVALALFKLSLIFGMESLQESPLSNLVDFYEILGSNWDLYLITTLIAILAGIVYFRRPQQPQN